MTPTPVPGLQVTRYQGDLQDPDVATAQTIELMGGYIDRAAQDPVLQRAARDAVRRFRGGLLYVTAGIDPWKSQQAQAESVWWWCKHALRFVHHDGLIQIWFNERDQLQLLISPDLLLRMDKPRGDCAIYTMLACAMLRALGVGYEFVTVAADPHQPDIYGHVYCRAVFPDGRRLALDTSHGKYPGWEVPMEHTIRKQVWSPGGIPVEDVTPRFRGLHAYKARPVYPILPKRIAMLPGVGLSGYIRMNRGLGDAASDSTAMAEAADYGTPAVAAPSAPGFSWANTVGNLLNQWTGIASNVIAPRNVITTGPQGTSINMAAGSPLPTGALLTPSLAGTSGSMMFWIGGGLLAVVLISSMLKGRR